eukprot:g61767.t1
MCGCHLACQLMLSAHVLSCSINSEFCCRLAAFAVILLVVGGVAEKYLLISDVSSLSCPGCDRQHKLNMLAPPNRLLAAFAPGIPARELKKRIRNLTLLLMVVMWYASSSVQTFSSKRFMGKDPSVFLLTTLTFLQLSVAALVGQMTAPEEINRLMFRCKRLGLVHFLAVLVTNFGVQVMGVAANTLATSTEPFFVLLLQYCLAGQPLVLQQFASVALCVVGSLLGVYDRLSSPLLALVLIGGFGNAALLAYRSVLFKGMISPAKQDTPSKIRISSTVLFLSLCTLAWWLMMIPMLLLAMQGSFAAMVVDRSVIASGLLSAVLYPASNVLSFKVLSRLSATSHSLVKLGKRVAVILVSATFFQQTLPINFLLGLLVSSFGVACYQYFRARQSKSTYLGVLLALSTRLAASVCMTFFLYLTFSKGGPAILQPPAKRLYELPKEIDAVADPAIFLDTDLDPPYLGLHPHLPMAIPDYEYTLLTMLDDSGDSAWVDESVALQ